MTLRDEYRAAVLSVGNKPQTFDAYWPHVDSFVRFCRDKHKRPVDRNDVTIDDVFDFRKHLAGTLHLAPKSCNQAISAIKLLFKEVIGRNLEDSDDRPLRLRQSQHVRKRYVSRQHVLSVMKCQTARNRLISQLQYAGMLRLYDVLHLRIKDINFDHEQIEIADTKHDHFRIVPFPRSLHEAVRRQIQSVEVLHSIDIESGIGGVPVDYAYARKKPSSPHDFQWYWLFPSDSLSRAPNDDGTKGTGPLLRWHLDDNNIRRTFSQSVKKSGYHRRMTPHDLRRAAATHAHIDDGVPLATIQKILGHSSIEQTLEYIMDGEAHIKGSDSPFDKLMAS